MKSLKMQHLKYFLNKMACSRSKTDRIVGAFNVTSNALLWGNTRNLSTVKAIKCWKCGHRSESIFALFCDKCSVIQAPHDRSNYFKVLNLNETFDIDEKTLTEKYRTLQSQLHPDKFSNRTAEEKDISQDYSSLLNKAHTVLQSPLKRAIHLLHLKGYDMHEDEKSDNKEFLMEIMELNEEVEQAHTPEKLKELYNKNKEVLKKSTETISECFISGDLKRAKEMVVKMKYYNSVMSYINNLLREQGIVD